MQINFWEFCLIIAGLSTLGAAASSWLHHRREMAKLKIEGKKQKQSGAESDELRQRLEALEKKCAAMQEQITDAHMLLADERRELDKRLAQALPDHGGTNDEPARRQSPAKTVM
jgi:predicted nuclease with TOPRIM domain